MCRTRKRRASPCRQRRFTRPNERDGYRVERLKLAAFIAALVLLAYGIRVDSAGARFAAIVVLIVGFALRFLNARKPNDV